MGEGGKWEGGMGEGGLGDMYVYGRGSICKREINRRSYIEK